MGKAKVEDVESAVGLVEIVDWSYLRLLRSTFSTCTFVYKLTPKA